MTPTRARFAATLFLIALGAALLFVFSYPLPAVRNDAVEYLSLARSIAHGNGFTMDGVTPAVFRPPLFSTLLGAWFYITGTSSPLSAAVAQSLLHAAGVLAAFLLFLELTPSLGWAAAGALFLAVQPMLVTRVTFVQQEPTLILSTTLAVWCSLRLLKAPSIAHAGAAGAAWGLCTLAKTVAWFAPFLFLAMRLLPRRLRGETTRREIAVVFLCFAAVVAPWTIRNYVQFNRLIPVNAQGGAMLEWNVQHTELPGDRPGVEVTSELDRRKVSDAERRRVLWRYVLDHPWHFFVWRVARNAIYFAAPARGWWDARGYMLPGRYSAEFWVLSALFHVPLYVLLLLRSWKWWKGKAFPTYGFLVLLYWAYWFEHAVIWGDPRFNLAVYPVLVAIALPLTHPAAGTVRRESTPEPA